MWISREEITKICEMLTKKIPMTSSIIVSIEQDWFAQKENPTATSKIISKGIGSLLPLLAFF